MSKRVVLAGAGGFGRGVYSWLASSPRHLMREEISDIVFIDDRLDSPELGLPWVSTIKGYSPEQSDEVLCCLGSPALRKSVSRDLEERGARFHTFVDDRAIIGDRVDVGAGAVICPGVVVSADVAISYNVHINFNCSIGHDVIIGRNATLSPSVNVMGEVTIGDSAFLGGSATILPRLEVGSNATVGAGAVVTAPVERNVTVVGNPARQTVRRRKEKDDLG